MNTRRQFLITAPLGVPGAAVACRGEPPAPASRTRRRRRARRRPSARRPASGPPVSAATFAEAEKLAQVTMTAAEREMAAAKLAAVDGAASRAARRAADKSRSTPDLAPATRWNPVLAGESSGPARDTFVRSPSETRSAARERRRHRVCAGDEAVALDRARSSSRPSG